MDRAGKEAATFSQFSIRDVRQGVKPPNLDTRTLGVYREDMTPRIGKKSGVKGKNASLRERRSVSRQAKQNSVEHKQVELARKNTMLSLLAIVVASIAMIVSCYQAYISRRQTELMNSQTELMSSQTQIMARQLDEQNEVEPEYEAVLELAFNKLYGNRLYANGERGFEVLCRRIIESSGYEYHKLNAGAPQTDEDYLKYGSDYEGFGPYYPSKGRWRGEVVSAKEAMLSFRKNDQCFFIYYKLGYRNNDGKYEPFGPSFLIDRLAIQVGKPRDLIYNWEKIVSGNVSRGELLELFDRCNIIVYPFRWGWDWQDSGPKGAPGLSPPAMYPRNTIRGVSEDCFLMADQINYAIYNRGKGSDRVVPPVPRYPTKVGQATE